MAEIKISVLCPTRNRTRLMERVLENCFETCSEPDKVEIIFGIDDDDTESIEMAKALQQEHPTRNVEYTVWPDIYYLQHLMEIGPITGWRMLLKVYRPIV